MQLRQNSAQPLRLWSTRRYSPADIESLLRLYLSRPSPLFLDLDGFSVRLSHDDTPLAAKLLSAHHEAVCTGSLPPLDDAWHIETAEMEAEAAALSAITFSDEETPDEPQPKLRQQEA